MTSHAQLEAALEAAAGDVHAAAAMIMASGRATEALKDEFEQIVRMRAELEQAEIAYAERAEALAKRKAEKAEARRIAVELAEDLKGTVIWGQPNPQFPLAPETVESVLHIVKHNMGVPETPPVRTDKFTPRFWEVRNYPGSYVRAGIFTLGTTWVRLDSVDSDLTSRGRAQGHFTLAEVSSMQDVYFISEGGREHDKTVLNLQYGVAVSVGNSDLPPLIRADQVNRYLVAKRMCQSLLEAVASIIPGVFGFEKRGKGQLVQPGVIKIAGVDGKYFFFSFERNLEGVPELTYKIRKQSGYFRKSIAAYVEPVSDSHTWRNALTKVTYDNAMKILRAWEELDDKYRGGQSILNQVSRTVWNRERDFSPHIAVMDNLEEDTAYYIDRATYEHDQAEEERQRQVALDRAAEQRIQDEIRLGGITNGTLMKETRYVGSGPQRRYRYHEFYRVVPEGEITDGKGNLLVQHFKSTFPEPETEYGLPDLADLEPDILLKNKLVRVLPAETRFYSRY